MLKTMVLLEWHDAHSGENDTWTPADEIEDAGPYLVKSIGWLISGVKAGHVTIAQSWTQDDQVDHLLHVPAGMVARCLSLNAGAEVLFPQVPTD